MNTPELRHYFGGEWKASSASQYQGVMNPATSEPLARVPLGSQEDVDAVVRAAAAAYPDGAELLPRTAFNISSR